jgi:hypothetical protein
MSKLIITLKKFLNNPLAVLLLIFTVGFVLRVFNIWDNFTFGYDQARDAQRIMDIVNLKNFKLVGQESDIPGVFHGALSYYVLAVVYFIGNFNPNFAAIFLSIVNLCGIFLIYYICNLLFNDKRIGLISALFWAVSFEQANFSRFISNASAMSITSIIFFLGLAVFIFKKKNIGLTISVIGFALSVQMNFYLLYLFVFYIIFYLIYRPKLELKVLLSNALLLVILFSPYIVAELKWNFMMSKSLATYFTSHHRAFDLIDAVAKYLNMTSQAIYFSFFALNNILNAIIFIVFSIIAWFNFKETKVKMFFFIWLFSTAPLFLTLSGVHSTQLINTTLFAPLTILVAFILTRFMTGKRILIFIGILLILFSNLYLFVKDGFNEIKLLSIQEFTLKHEKSLIDYTYKSSQGKPFSICALTNPLFINVLWSYLYGTYGKQKYGYVPFWAGQEQVAFNNNLPYDKNHVPQRFIILEPNAGIADYVKPVFVYMEDNTSTLKEERNFSDLIVQKRILNTDLSIFNDTQNLKTKEIKSIKSIIKSNPRFSCYTTYIADK